MHLVCVGVCGACSCGQSAAWRDNSSAQQQVSNHGYVINISIRKYTYIT